MNISIIIPNYNGEKILKANLPKVINAAEFYAEKNNEQVEIIIVDDCSSDNSIEESQRSKIKSQKYNLKFKIIRNEKNVGFSSTVNKGVKEAGGEVIVLLNTDVVPEKEFLVPLLQHFKNDKVFAVGCMDKSIEYEKIVLRGRGVGRWERGFLVHQRGEVNKSNTLWVSGGSGAFRKSLWDFLGGFNQLYNPFYWEDIDLSYRALKSGYRILFEPKSIVVHTHYQGSVQSNYSESQIKTTVYRNQIMFFWLNVTDLSLQFQHLVWLPYHFAKALFRKDWAFFAGFFQCCILFPNILQYTFKVQKLFKLSDRKVVQEFTV